MFKRNAVASGVLVLASGLALVGLGGASTTSPHQVSPPTLAQLEALKQQAVDFAAANGETAPTEGQLVSATRQSVVSAAMGGAGVDSDQDVYVIRLRGNFIGYEAPVPKGMPFPRGHFLLLVYDASTNELVDWGLRAQSQDLSQFGKPLPIIP
jgi:hypothetical protein